MRGMVVMKMNGARILVEELIHQGVEVIFGYPGGSVLNIYDELYLASDRIKHVLAAHEQGASHAADGYARASGRRCPGNERPGSDKPCDRYRKCLSGFCADGGNYR